MSESRARCTRSFVLVLLSFLLSGCAGSLIGPGFPALGDAQVEVRGIDAPVRIDYDNLFVPHVRALTTPDAFFGLGYAMGSARLFQMDLLRHMAKGNVSGLLDSTITVRQAGKTRTVDVLEVDYFLRAMDFFDTGGRYLKTASPESRAFFAAYADGINAFVEANGKRLSAPYSIPETVGGMRFEPWTDRDSASVMILTAWLMAKNTQEEYFAALALQAGVSLPKIVDLLSPHQPLNPDRFAYLEGQAQEMAGRLYQAAETYRQALQPAPPSQDRDLAP